MGLGFLVHKNMVTPVYWVVYTFSNRPISVRFRIASFNAGITQAYESTCGHDNNYYTLKIR